MTGFVRSFLFTPATRPDRFAKAAATATQGIILDLEDAVAEADKDSARDNVRAYLAERDNRDTQLAVRINPLTRACGLLDLAMLASSPAAPDFILLPKAEEPEHLALVGQVLADAGSNARIGALIESARGVANAAALATSHERLDWFMFGAADYAADLGQQVGTIRHDHARAVIVNAAASGGIVAIDSPFFAIDQADALQGDCDAAKDLGFHGKAAIHPSQVDAINSTFAPSDEDREQARRILEAAPDGVGVLDGKMIDIAMVRWARRNS